MPAPSVVREVEEDKAPVEAPQASISPPQPTPPVRYPSMLSTTVPVGKRVNPRYIPPATLPQHQLNQSRRLFDAVSSSQQQPQRSSSTAQPARPPSPPSPPPALRTPSTGLRRNLFPPQRRGAMKPSKDTGVQIEFDRSRPAQPVRSNTVPPQVKSRPQPPPPPPPPPASPPPFVAPAMPTGRSTSTTSGSSQRKKSSSSDDANGDDEEDFDPAEEAKPRGRSAASKSKKSAVAPKRKKAATTRRKSTSARKSKSKSKPRTAAPRKRRRTSSYSQSWIDDASEDEESDFSSEDDEEDEASEAEEAVEDEEGREDEAEAQQEDEEKHAGDDDAVEQEDEQTAPAATDADVHMEDAAEPSEAPQSDVVDLTTGTQEAAAMEDQDSGVQEIERPATPPKKPRRKRATMESELLPFTLTQPDKPPTVNSADDFMPIIEDGHGGFRALRTRRASAAGSQYAAQEKALAYLDRLPPPKQKRPAKLPPGRDVPFALSQM